MSVEKFKPLPAGQLKHEKNTSFTTLPNHALQNCRNAAALGLWCNLQSRPANWEVSPKNIQNHFNIGRDKAYKLLHYLIEIGLLEHVREIKENGNFGGSFYIVKNGEAMDIEKAQSHDLINIKKQPASHVNQGIEPFPEKPDTEKPDTDNQYTTNKRSFTNKRVIKKNRDKARAVDNFLDPEKKKATSSDCSKQNFKNLKPIPSDFSPNDEEIEKLNKTAIRVKMSPQELLIKFISVCTKYKTKSGNWNETFLAFLERERPKRVYEDASGKLRRYDGGQLHY